MPILKPVSELDAQFYQAADAFFAAQRDTALTYDDVTLDNVTGSPFA